MTRPQLRTTASNGDLNKGIASILRHWFYYGVKCTLGTVSSRIEFPFMVVDSKNRNSSKRFFRF